MAKRTTARAAGRGGTAKKSAGPRAKAAGAGAKGGKPKKAKAGGKGAATPGRSGSGRSGQAAGRPALAAPFVAPPGTDPAAARVVRRTTIHAGKKYAYVDVAIRADDGSVIHRQMVKHPGAVTVVPLLDTPDGIRVVIIRNERFAVGKTLIELPAGTLEPNEDPSVSGVRELEEEIGYTSRSLAPLGSFYTTPGLTDEIMHCYAATNLEFVGQRLEADEKIRVEVVTPDEAFAMVDDGRMMDAKSMLALLLARRRGLV